MTHDTNWPGKPTSSPPPPPDAPPSADRLAAIEQRVDHIEETLTERTNNHSSFMVNRQIHSDDTIEDLQKRGLVELSCRARNALRTLRIKTIPQLLMDCGMVDIINCKGCGLATAQEVEGELERITGFKMKWEK